MPFTQPFYAARYDWENKIQSPPGNVTWGWQVDMANLWGWVKTGTLGSAPLSLEDAWAKLNLSPEFAKAALSRGPVRYNNSVGAIPPQLASRVFARSIAKSIDPDDDYPDLTIGPDITSMTTEERSFRPPGYTPRADWKTKLESLTPAAGSWQKDLRDYWELRKSGRKEHEAWAAVAMSPQNAKLALSTEAPTPGNESGLIPCTLDGDNKDTVARRVFARSVAKTIDPNDIYNDLRLE
jgi:hypothetical protein